jgi:protein-S-isoprenylcysteine O-methyltransferase Ste14
MCSGLSEGVKDMYPFDQKILGIMMLLLLGALVLVKRAATGSVLDVPRGSVLVRLANGFNLFCLLIVIPFAAVSLITGFMETVDPFRIFISDHWFSALLEIAGLVFYTTGFILMAWALICLGENYQIGGTALLIKDKMIINGPYKIIRHPMYSAALSISLGLAGLIQSWVIFGVFGLYFIFINLLTKNH